MKRFVALMFGLSLSMTQCAPVEAQDCISPEGELALAAEAGIGPEHTDHNVKTNQGDGMIRVWSHEDHFDVVLFIKDCFAASASELDQGEVDTLLARFR